MKKIAFLGLMFSGLFFIGTAWGESFDGGKVAQVMEINLSSLRKAHEAVAAREDYNAAAAFYAIAHADRALLSMDPPQASKADWDRLFHRLIDTALEGVGAAGEHNHARQVELLRRLEDIRNAGHAEFR